MSQDWNQPPAPQQLPPSGWGAPPGGAPMGGPPGGQPGGQPGGYGPPPGGPGGYGAPPPAGIPGGGGAENNLALASVICGGISVVSLLCCCIPFVNYIVWVVAPLTGIAAIITGILGLREANETGVRKNEAIAGIAMGSIGFVMIAIVILIAVLGVGSVIAAGAMQPH